MHYLTGIEISHVEMQSKEETLTTSSPNKSKVLSLAGLKLLQLILVVLCIALIDDPVVHSSYKHLLSQRTISLCYATFGAFCIYTIIYILSKLVSDASTWKSDAVWSFIGFILFLACAGTLLREWTNIKERNYWHPNTQRLDFICATGAISILASLLYLIDLILTIYWGVRGEFD